MLQHHLDDLFLKERFDMVNQRSRLLKESDRKAAKLGFQGYPPIGYLRKLD